MADRLKTRVRANFKKTSQKAGYSPDYTIEAEWGGDDMDDEEALYRWGQLIEQVRNRAFLEVNTLNVREGYPIIPTDVVKHEEDNSGVFTSVREHIEHIDEDTGEVTE